MAKTILAPDVGNKAGFSGKVTGAMLCILSQASRTDGTTMAFLGGQWFQDDAPYALVGRMVKAGLLDRWGRRNCYRYRTTAQGRALLPENK